MAYRFPMKQVAFQAGLSLATVDRVLNARPGVRQVTRHRVQSAILELERQYAATGVTGRRLSLDIVMETPTRFGIAVRRAFETELAGLRPANVTLRFHLQERWTDIDLSALLTRIRRRGSHGVVLKARATPAIIEAATRLMENRIPVATFVTDLPKRARLAYIGIDNHKAGATVAGLMARMLHAPESDVLVTLSSARFSGEGDRALGFETEFSKAVPERKVIRAAEGMGLDLTTEGLVENKLADHPNIGAVYSVGGANRAVIRAFDRAKRQLHVFAAHDMDRTNRALLAERQLTFVIDHDLRQDARTACQIMLHHHHMLPDEIDVAPSRFTVMTPQSL